MTEKTDQYEKKVLSLLEQIANQTKNQSVPVKEESSKPIVEEHRHFQVSDDICPECYPAIKSKVLDKEHKESEYFCIDCGYPLGDEQTAKEKEKCPSCGSEHAKKKSW